MTHALFHDAFNSETSTVLRETKRSRPAQHSPRAHRSMPHPRPRLFKGARLLRPETSVRPSEAKRSEAKTKGMRLFFTFPKRRSRLQSIGYGLHEVETKSQITCFRATKRWLPIIHISQTIHLLTSFEHKQSSLFWCTWLTW